MMQSHSHANEDAELYALGLLSEEDRTALEAHAAECAECLRRLGEAEETVLALERRSVAPGLAFELDAPRFSRRGISAWWLASAAAAAFVLGALMWHGAPRENPALVAIARSHFSHALFTGGGAPQAKVLYARDRSWYYVVVVGSKRYDVYGIADGTARPLGTTATAGSEITDLFAPVGARFDRLELRANGRTIETAEIR